jgi:hypothetical protein
VCTAPFVASDRLCTWPRCASGREYGPCRRDRADPEVVARRLREALEPLERTGRLGRTATGQQRLD